MRGFGYKFFTCTEVGHDDYPWLPKEEVNAVEEVEDEGDNSDATKISLEDG